MKLDRNAGLSQQEVAGVAPGDDGDQVDVTGHLPARMAERFWLLRVESKPVPKTVLVCRRTNVAMAQMWKPAPGGFGYGEVETLWAFATQLTRMFPGERINVVWKAMRLGLTDPGAGRMN